MASGVFRHMMLTHKPDQTATENDLYQAQREIYNSLETWKVYDRTPAQLPIWDLSIRCRSVIDCVTDSTAEKLAVQLRKHMIDARVCDDSRPQPMVYDLFCGSGNLAYHIHKTISCTLKATEINRGVWSTTMDNFRKIGLAGKPKFELINRDYRDMLTERQISTGPEIYIVDPPLGKAVTDQGLDFEQTVPSLPEILGNINGRERGRICWIVLKATDDVFRPSFDRVWKGYSRVAKIDIRSDLPRGRNTVFYVYAL